MPQQICDLLLDRSGRELQAHGSSGFPCASYFDYYRASEPEILPWHWHEEFEIIQAISGCIVLQIPGRTMDLQPGETAVINSGILHAAYGNPDCRVCSIVFHPVLVTGTSESVFSEKYIRPLTGCTNFQAVRLRDDGLSFTKAFRAMQDQAPGFEFEVREHLSRICMLLFRHFEHEIELGPLQTNPDMLRIRSMLRYIHEHFTEPVTIAEIADSAHIGERECLRCFQRTIHISPGQYLLHHRITQGASLLRSQPERSIAQIAAACGFESPSNFSWNFRRYFKCTPREYRKAAAQRPGEQFIMP